MIIPTTDNRQLCLYTRIYSDRSMRVCAHHMYSCINKRSDSEREIISEHHVKKMRGKKRESNKTNHFGPRPRNNRLIVDDDTTRHTYWRKMVPTCIVYMRVCVCVCVREMNYGFSFPSFSSAPIKCKICLNNRRCVSLLAKQATWSMVSLFFLAWFQRDDDDDWNNPSYRWK